MNSLRIGLTGGIGAGKSTVARALAAAGAEIVDSDVIARQVVEPGQPALAGLVRAFGPGILAPDGGLDRQALAAVAFADRESTARLGAILHPAIAERTGALMAASRADIVVNDVPLLVENGLSANYHLAILVDVPAEIRLRRLVENRGMDADDARQRISRQADDRARYAACDIVIGNAGAPEATREQIEHLLAERLRPFAANLAAGRPARPRGVEPIGAAARARISARLRRALAATGERFTLGEAFAITVADAGVASRLASPLEAAGYPLADGGAGAIVHRGADPALPAEVAIHVT